MEIFMSILIVIGIIVVIGGTFLVTTGYDNFKGITLQLDEMYTNTEEMACAVYDELKKQGKECEIIEMGKGYPKFMVDSKKYTMVYKMASIKGFPVQTVQLKLCKE